MYYAYFPHEGIVVVCFDFAGVDHPALEWSKLGASGQYGLCAEHAVVKGSREGSLENGHACNTTHGETNSVFVGQMEYVYVGIFVGLTIG